MSRTRYGGTPGAGDGRYSPNSYVPEGYSLDKAYQDQEPGGTIRKRTSRGAGRDGLRVQNSRINYYKIEDRPQAPAPAPPPEQEEEEYSSPTESFDDRLSGIRDQFSQQNDDLMSQLSADRANYAAMMERMEQSIRAYQNSYSQGSSVGGQETALMINPAQSVATKSRSVSKGTQQFNRQNRNLKISNVSI